MSVVLATQYIHSWKVTDFALCYLGIRQSLQVDLTFIAFELGICVLLAIFVLVGASSKGQLSVTPFNAVVLLCIVTLVVGISLGLWLTPIGAYGFLGTLDTLAVLLIYALVNIACFRFFFVKHRDRFNWFRHAVIPLVATIALVAVFSSVRSPTFPGSAALLSPICASTDNQRKCCPGIQ